MTGDARTDAGSPEDLLQRAGARRAPELPAAGPAPVQERHVRS